MMNPPTNPSTNPAPQADPLAELRDIHLPDPVSWWPPAPGWWLLLLCAIGIVVALIWWWRRRSLRKSGKTAIHYSRSQMLAQARLELTQMELTQMEAGESKNDSAVVVELSALVRRVAVNFSNGNDQQRVAGLSGEAWLQWLDSQWNQDLFCNGDGRMLLDAPYRPHAESDSAALFSLIRAWLKALDRGQES